jgi:glycosyltransferase involved in cell wall biosynthesis
MDQTNLKVSPIHPSEPLTTTWFDVTDVVEFMKEQSSVNGIQRLVSMLIIALDSIETTIAGGSKSPAQVEDGRKAGFLLCRYDFNRHVYIRIPRDTFLATLQQFLSGSTLPSNRSRLPTLLKRPLFQFASFVANSRLRPFVPGKAISLGTVILDYVFERRGLMESGPTPCQFSPGATFVALGAFWFRPFYINIISSVCHAHKLLLFLTVYDLIPIRFPEWFPPNDVSVWSGSVELGIRSANHVVLISRYVEQDFLAFCCERNIPAPQSTVLRLGDEMAEVHDVAHPTILRRVAKYRQPGFVLVVSSIDVRKNQEFLIGVWERLYRKYRRATPYLILIGKPGTDYARIMRAMRKAKFVDQRIVMLDDVGDRELRVFYQHALFTMLPSITEGWGLPVAESMALGKMCIASKVASIPEIAGALVEYFDPHDTDGCLQLVQRYAFDGELRSAAEARIRAQYCLTTWKDTARSLVGAIESSDSR